MMAHLNTHTDRSVGNCGGSVANSSSKTWPNSLRRGYVILVRALTSMWCYLAQVHYHLLHHHHVGCCQTFPSELHSSECIAQRLCRRTGRMKVWWHFHLHRVKWACLVSHVKGAWTRLKACLSRRWRNYDFMTKVRPPCTLTCTPSVSPFSGSRGSKRCVLFQVVTTSPLWSLTTKCRPVQPGKPYRASRSRKLTRWKSRLLKNNRPTYLLHDTCSSIGKPIQECCAPCVPFKAFSVWGRPDTICCVPGSVVRR